MGKRVAVERLALALLASLMCSSTAEASTGCHRSRLDYAAREIIFAAQTSAEVIAVDHDGSYRQVSPIALHQVESLIPITPRQAAKNWGKAYLVSASGTIDSYVVTARASTGNTFTLRISRGKIIRTARICGKTRPW